MSNERIYISYIPTEVTGRVIRPIMDSLNMSILSSHIIIKFSSLRSVILILFVLGIGILLIKGSLASCGLELQDGWIDFGGSSWYIDDYNSGSSEKSPSLKSGPIECSGVSRICRIVKGPATVSFLWKTDANYYDIGQLNFLVNGERKYVCGSAEGEKKSFNLRNQGDYILSWEFIKLKSYPEYFGAGWIRDICIAQGANESSEATGIPAQLQSVGMIKGNDIVYVDHNEDIINNTFSSFQEAIKHVSEDGVVKVNRGTYFENIVINKPLKLEGADRNQTIINVAGDIIRVHANDVIIANLTLVGGHRGLNLSNSQNCEIKNINIIRCMKGVELQTCDGAIIVDNDFSDNELGIFVMNSSYCQINQNNILGPEATMEYNESKGILFAHSDSNIVDMNKISRNYLGIVIQSKSKNNTITNRNHITNIITCDLYFEMEEEDLHGITTHNYKCEINASCDM